MGALAWVWIFIFVAPGLSKGVPRAIRSRAMTAIQSDPPIPFLSVPHERLDYRHNQGKHDKETAGRHHAGCQKATFQKRRPAS